MFPSTTSASSVSATICAAIMPASSAIEECLRPKWSIAWSYFGGLAWLGLLGWAALLRSSQSFAVMNYCRRAEADFGSLWRRRTTSTCAFDFGFGRVGHTFSMGVSEAF